MGSKSRHRHLGTGCIVVAALAMCRCTGYVHVDPAARSALQARHVGKVMELRHSHYYGDLYDDNERWLLSSLPFADTYHLVDLHGRPITPKRQRGLFPAGTPMQVVAIEFPTAWRVAARMVTTPRYNIWVILRTVAQAGAAAPLGPDLVLVLPDDIADVSGAETALNQMLAPAGDVSAWLEQVRPTVRVAVAHKDILAGMNVQELVASQGEPVHWLADQLPDGRACRVAWYPHHEVWVAGDAVQQIRASRSLEAP